MAQDDDQPLFVGPDFVRAFERMRRWQRNFKVNGAAFRNDPDGPSLTISIPRPPPVVPVPFALLYAVYQTLWEPGKNYVQVNPCQSDSNSTPISTDSSAYIYLAIQSPWNRPATAFNAEVGDRISYVPLPLTTVTTDGKPLVGLVWPQPVAPQSSDQYEVMSNLGGSAADFRAGFVQAHESPS